MEEYTPIKISDRIAKLKEEYKDVKTIKYGEALDIPNYREYNTGDRLLTLGFLDGWYAHKDMYPLRLRRSYAEAAELDWSEPVFYDDELIVGNLYLPDLNDEDQKRYDELAKSFSDSVLDLSKQGARRDHIAADFDKLLKVGVETVLAEIKEKKSEISLADYEPDDMSCLEKEEFYDCLIVELEALLRLEQRYADKARELAKSAKTEKRKAELIRIADALDRVPRKPAESFFEAVQSVHFFLSNLFGLYTLGRPDRYLYPYYENDIKSEKITKEEAQELVDCFCLGVSTRVFSRAACGFIVGGSYADGSVCENDLTYMFITALEHIRMSDPNGALAVNSKTSDKLLKYAVDVIAKGCTHPAFYNDEGIISSLMKCWKCPKEDAVNFIHSTCAELTIAGKSKGHTTTTAINIPKILLDTVNANPDIENIDCLIDKFCDNVSAKLYSDMHRYVMSILEAKRNGNDAMRVCAFIDDCVERGKSVYGGGARYEVMLPIFVGFANVVDSLEAIRKLVYEEKRYTLAEFAKIVNNNFEGNEPLRQYILNKIEHYGNDCKTVDAHAGELAKKLEDVVMKRKMPGGKYLFPGTFSYVNHAVFGGETGATFDGRLAGKSLSDGCCPGQGMDTHGPTALINSLTSWDQSKFIAGMVVNLKFAKSNFADDKRMLLANIIRTFMKKGGLELQVNSVDRATLEDALVHPEAHRDLIVRIGGYSDYFVRLAPVLKQEIIDRTEY